MGELLSSIHAESLDSCSDADLVAVKRAARNLRGRVDALACVATQKVDKWQAAQKTLGTPTASLIAIDEHLDSKRAVGQVSRAKDVARHGPAKAAALSGEISTEQAEAIARGIAGLPELPPGVQERVAAGFVAQAHSTAANQLARLAPKVLAQVAPEHALSRESAQDRAARQREAAVKNRRWSWGNDGEGSVWFKGNYLRWKQRRW